jgi:hypothetical protein
MGRQRRQPLREDLRQAGVGGVDDDVDVGRPDGVAAEAPTGDQPGPFGRDREPDEPQRQDPTRLLGRLLKERGDRRLLRRQDATPTGAYLGATVTVTVAVEAPPLPSSTV